MPIGTKHNTEEPRGFSRSPFGDPASVDKEFRTKGFGDPITLTKSDDSNKGTTQSNEDSNNGTTFTDYTDD